MFFTEVINNYFLSYYSKKIFTFLQRFLYREFKISNNGFW